MTRTIILNKETVLWAKTNVWFSQAKLCTPKSGRTGSSMKLFSSSRPLYMAFGILLITMLLAACGNSAAPSGGSSGSSGGGAAATNGKGCTKVGVLLPETASSARWDSKDKPLLTKSIEAISGVTVDFYNAEGDATKQQNQADTALTKGDCILVVAASDAAQAAAIVAKA